MLMCCAPKKATHLACSIHSAVSGGEKEMVFFIVLITRSWGKLMPLSRGDTEGVQNVERGQKLCGEAAGLLWKDWIWTKQDDCPLTHGISAVLCSCSVLPPPGVFPLNAKRLFGENPES